MSFQKVQKVTFVEKRAILVPAAFPELSSNQVLIKSHYSLIGSGTERAALSRVWDDADFRENPGFALAGQVVEIGSDVMGIKTGDRVITLLNHASYVAAAFDPWVTLKIPANVSYETSTFLPLASVALHAIRRAKIEIGETVAIVGAGIIGLVAVQLARLCGVKQVIVLDFVDKRLDLARLYGADFTINPGQADAVEEVLKATEGKGVSLVMEATGDAKVIPLAFRMTSFGGRVISVGVMEEAIEISFHKDFIQRELTLVAAYQPLCPTTENIYWRWTQQTNRQLLLDLITQGKLHVDEMITHRISPAQTPLIYKKILKGDPEMLGVMIDWE